MAGGRMTSGKTSDVAISLNMHRRKQETGLYIWRFKLGLISAFSVFPYVYFFSFFQITVIIIIAIFLFQVFINVLIRLVILPRSVYYFC